MPKSVMLASLVKPDDQPIKGSYQGHFKDLRFPFMASYKYDGIRAWKKDNAVLSRSNLPIANNWIRRNLATLPDGPDGELVTYTNGVMDGFHTVQSKVMSEDGVPEFKYWVFDFIRDGFEWEPAIDRAEYLRNWSFGRLGNPSDFGVYFANQKMVYNVQELEVFEAEAVGLGYEGICLKPPHAPYKAGRSTFNEQYLLKLKRFVDSEAIVVDVTTLKHNLNEATIDEVGRTKRSKAQEGMIADERRLGTLVVQDIKSQIQFEIGTGFTEALRLELMEKWVNGTLKGSMVTYKHQPYGAKEGGRPRIPVFRGIRYDLELPEL